jgi:hypothetical protein
VQGPDGKQYLFGMPQTMIPCGAEWATLWLGAGTSLLQPVQNGGGLKLLAPTSFCGTPLNPDGSSTWPEMHVGCARNAPYCVTSTYYNGYGPYALAPGDTTTPISASPFRGELILTKVDGSEYRRIAKHWSVEYTNDSYNATPRGSLSPDASYILADSNFGVANNEHATVWNTQLNVQASSVAAPVGVTVATSPAGLPVMVDGTSFTTPQTFEWVPSSFHTVGINQTPGSIPFLSWSDGGAQTHTISVPETATTYTANFQAGSLSVAAISGTAAFLRTDSTTAGAWRGVYGADGYNVIGDSSRYPAYVTVTPSGNDAWTWSESGSASRSLQKASNPSDRIASCWYSSGSFNVDMNFNDQLTHQVALYFTDWDYDGPRIQQINVFDANQKLLDTRTISQFTSGDYLIWNLGGHVTFRIFNVGPSNAVVSGIFFR